MPLRCGGAAGLVICRAMPCQPCYAMLCYAMQRTWWYRKAVPLMVIAHIADGESPSAPAWEVGDERKNICHMSLSATLGCGGAPA